MLERAFGLLLRLLPAAFREEFGALMRRTFAMRAADAARRGRLSLVRFAAREFAGLLRAAIVERITERAERRARHSPAHHEVRGVMDAMMKELRHALRGLARTPGFTAAAVLTLALAIGANTAIFTLLNRVVLSPLPFPHSDRLVVLDHAAPGLNMAGGMGMSGGLFREYVKLPAIEAISLVGGTEGTLIAGDSPERLQAMAAMPSLTDVLGIAPARGRWFAAEEGLPGGPSVVVLSHALWTRSFGADPAVLGTTVRINGMPHELIGVMPADFSFPGVRADYFIPFPHDPETTRAAGFGRGSIARIAPGMTTDALAAQLNTIIADMPNRFPGDAMARAMVESVQLAALPIPLEQQVVGPVARMLWVLVGSVAVVLLIACANLANLFLVRAEARQREVAVRRALGAGSRRVGGFFLAETLLVALLGGVLGLVLAHAGLQLLVAYSPVELPRLNEVRIDAVSVAWTVPLAAIAGCAFGLLPVLRSRVDVFNVLQDGGRGSTAGAGRMRARNVLMAAQLAFAMMLLVAAGLLLQSFLSLRTADPGFAGESRLIFQLALPATEYPDEAAAAFQERALDALRGLPGVRAAALSTTLPLQGDGRRDVLQLRAWPLVDGEVNAVAQFRRVSANYFETMRIALVQGRVFDERDMQGAGNPVVIDEALARAYFPDVDPIGQQLQPVGATDEWHTVIGIVAGSPVNEVRESPAPHLYFPIRSEAAGRTLSVHLANFVLVTGDDPLAVLPGVRRAIAALDATVPLIRPERMSDLIARTGARTTFTMVLVGIAAAMSLLLGIIGAYAVISYGVALRRDEIGVRLALGARPADVSGMIVRQSAAVITCGIIFGTVAALAGARTLESLLFDIAWNDAITYAIVAAGLLAVGLLASWVPASRAARVSPLESLR